MNTDSAGLWVEDQALNSLFHTENYFPCCFIQSESQRIRIPHRIQSHAKEVYLFYNWRAWTQNIFHEKSLHEFSGWLSIFHWMYLLTGALTDLLALKENITLWTKDPGVNRQNWLRQGMNEDVPFIKGKWIFNWKLDYYKKLEQLRQTRMDSCWFQGVNVMLINRIGGAIACLKKDWLACPRHYSSVHWKIHQMHVKKFEQ